MAFSAGIVPEFVEYARYLKTFAADPDLVIVGVDAFNFWRSMKVDVPDFVALRKLPPSSLQRYLSLGAIRFSLRTLIQDSPFPRYYDRQFIGRVWGEAPDYEPPRLIKRREDQGPFDASRIRFYRELRQVFPEARFVGYVPPLAAWEVAEELYVPGYLDRYLKAVGEIAADYDAFYDFSIPSSVTKDPRHTYDGDHFDAGVNEAIARALRGGDLGFGIVVDPERLEDYRRDYTAALQSFVEQQRRAPQPASPVRASVAN